MFKSAHCMGFVKFVSCDTKLQTLRSVFMSNEQKTKAASRLVSKSVRRYAGTMA